MRIVQRNRQIGATAAADAQTDREVMAAIWDERADGRPAAWAALKERLPAISEERLSQSLTRLRAARLIQRTGKGYVLSPKRVGGRRISDAPSIDEILAGDAQALKKAQARLSLSLDEVAERMGVPRPYAAQLIDGAWDVEDHEIMRLIAPLQARLWVADAAERRRCAGLIEAVISQHISELARDVAERQGYLESFRAQLRPIIEADRAAKGKDSA